MHMGTSAYVGLDLGWEIIGLVTERAPGAPVMVSLVAVDCGQCIRGITGIRAFHKPGAGLAAHGHNNSSDRDGLTQIVDIASTVRTMTGRAVHRGIVLVGVVIVAVVRRVYPWKF